MEDEGGGEESLTGWVGRFEDDIRAPRENQL